MAHIPFKTPVWPPSRKSCRCREGYGCRKNNQTNIQYKYSDKSSGVLDVVKNLMIFDWFIS